MIQIEGFCVYDLKAFFRCLDQRLVDYDLQIEKKDLGYTWSKPY